MDLTRESSASSTHRQWYRHCGLARQSQQRRGLIRLSPAMVSRRLSTTQAAVRFETLVPYVKRRPMTRRGLFFLA